MERIAKFYEYCEIQPSGTKTYLPLLHPTGINVKINTHIVETIYSEKLTDHIKFSKTSNFKSEKNKKPTTKKVEESRKFRK